MGTDPESPYSTLPTTQSTIRSAGRLDSIDHKTHDARVGESRRVGRESNDFVHGSFSASSFRTTRLPLTATTHRFRIQSPPLSISAFQFPCHYVPASIECINTKHQITPDYTSGSRLILYQHCHTNTPCQE